MNEDSMQPIITRKRIAIVILAFFLVILLWFVFTITRSGWLELSAGSNVARGTVVSVEVSRDEPGNEPQKVSFKAGETKKIFIKKGTVRVNAEADNIKSVDVVTVKALSTSKVTAPHGELRAIQKLASNTSYCANVVGGKVYSFNCGGEGLVYEHNPLDSSSLDTRRPMFDTMSFALMQPLQNGAIGQQYAEEDSVINIISYANLETDQLQNLHQTEEISTLLNDEYPYIKTSADINKPYFMMIFSRGNKAFLYDSVADTEPLALTLPENATLKDSFGITTFSFHNDRIVVYAGQTDVTDIDEGTPLNEKEKKYGNNIYEFDLKGNLLETVDLPKDFVSGGITKISDNFYAVDQRNSLEFYYRDGNNFTKLYTFAEAEDPLVVGNKAYIVVKGAIFSFVGKSGGQFSLNSIFSSPNISASRVFQTGDNIVFTGVPERLEEPVVDLYQLLDSQQTTKPLEEVLDFERLRDYVTGYDYDDQRVIFWLRSTGYGFEYEQIRSRMVEKLKELGMDTGGRQVELYPLN